MERVLTAWHAVATWALGQPAIIRVAVGTATLLLAYLLFVGALSMLMRLGGKPEHSRQRE